MVGSFILRWGVFWAALSGWSVQGSQADPAPFSNREFVYGILLDGVLEPDSAQGLAERHYPCNLHWINRRFRKCPYLASAAATVIFAMGIQDQLMDSISNGFVAWNAVELAYSFLFAVLSALSVWLSFSFSNRHPAGSSAGYIAAGLFFVVHTGLYAFPCYLLYSEVQNNRQEDEIHVQPAHPFREVPYQDL